MSQQEIVSNIVWHQQAVLRGERHRLNGHKSAVLWLTGLSGSGKSTIGNAIDHLLHQSGIRSYVLDGDNIRHGLNKGLGFTEEDRKENIRRIGEVSKLFIDAGLFPITAFISPFRADRDLVRALVGDGEFIEIFIDCPIEECEKRDPKGLYQKARRGEIPNFTGISSPYEPPSEPEITLRSDQLEIKDAAELVVHFLREKGYFNEA
jgi:adenylylsulfate kinase